MLTDSPIPWSEDSRDIVFFFETETHAALVGLELF